MSAASTFNGMPKPKCYHVIHESDWMSLCHQGGIDLEQLPAMKTGLDTTAALVAESGSSDHAPALLQPLEV